MNKILNKLFFTFLFTSIIIGCGTLKNKHSTSENAESYYLKAFDILNNTTHNSLSDSLSSQALNYIDKAISINSKISKYHRVKGSTYIHRREYNTAIPYFEKAIEIDSNNSLAWMGLGIAYENISKFEMAEKNYLKALDDIELSRTVFFNLGLLYSKWGKYNSSIESYSNAIKIYPKYRGAYLNRGKVKLGLKKYAEAIADFNMAIRLDPTDKVSYNNRGLALHYTNKFNEAIQDFKKALEINLDNSFNENFDTNKYAYNNIANSYYAMSDTENACIYWNKAIEVGYKYQIEWKEEYDIDDPVELIKEHCSG
jgi:tetratricopeptide (TPR) repeat protein